MTLRDYFAGKAMQGLVGTIGRVWEVGQLSIDAYAIADAMLAARGQEQNHTDNGAA